jgi:hypothetical protein
MLLPMKIIEQFTAGKAGPDANEDKLTVGDDFIGVFDGVTSRQGNTLRGVSTGRFAAGVLAEALHKLPKDIEGPAAVNSLNATLLAEAKKAGAEEGKEFKEIWSYPAAALLVYSRARKEIWRVADSTFVLKGKPHYRSFPQEETWAQLRRAFICAKLARGMTEQELLDDDPSWPLLTPIISELKIFANHAGPFGYGVLNGSPVPAIHIEVFSAKDAGEIIFASDGYPEVFGTLDETESHIAKVLAEDPLMYKLYPQVKGVKKGHVSFDDRTYIRFMGE